MKGLNGAVSGSPVSMFDKLDSASKQSFPKKLLTIIRRQAVDLLLGDVNNTKGIDALHFIVNVTTERQDAKDILQGNLIKVKVDHHQRVVGGGGGTPYLRKFGNLSIREISVNT